MVDDFTRQLKLKNFYSTAIRR